VFVSDALTLDAPRRTNDGYLAVRAKAARTGVYQYSGVEVDPDNKHGLRDNASVNVLRDDDAVFDKRAVHSFIGKPITDDHPTEAVTAANWRDHSRGAIMGAIRDGDHLAFDLILMDSATIAKVESGKAELSNGYSAALEFGDFKGPGGEACPVRQTSITGNHIAIVDRGRAGPSCRIGDAALCDALPSNLLPTMTDGESIVTTKTITFDGLPLLVTDAAEAAIGKLQAQIAGLTTDKATLETNVATLTTDKATLEAEKVTLTKQVADAALTPQQLRDAAKSYATVVGKAQAMGVTVADSMDEPAIKRAVVDKALGDLAKGWNDVQVDASFASLTKDAKVADTTIHPIGAPLTVDGTKDATDARAAMIADMLKPTTAAA
jgi:hypothetical protein